MSSGEPDLRLGIPLPFPQAAKPKPSKALQKFLTALWAHRGKSEANFIAKGEELAQELGIIDRLTPRLRILRHTDSTVPGELRIKMATMNVVMVEAHFAEAPNMKVVMDVPMDKFVPGMERKISGVLFPRLIQLLVLQSQRKK